METLDFGDDIWKSDVCAIGFEGRDNLLGGDSWEDMCADQSWRCGLDDEEEVVRIINLSH